MEVFGFFIFLSIIGSLLFLFESKKMAGQAFMVFICMTLLATGIMGGIEVILK